MDIGDDRVEELSPHDDVRRHPFEIGNPHGDAQVFPRP
jgi:hypothetical protein